MKKVILLAVYQLKKTLLMITMKLGKKINILSAEDSLDLVLTSGLSLTRFGDGEFNIMNGGKIGFQQSDAVLAKALANVLTNPINTCLIGIPDTLSYFNNLTEESERFWVNYMFKWRKKILPYLDEKTTYISANITRPYLRYKNKSVCKSYFESLKKIWSNKDLLIVEGTHSHLGIGNDLFNDCRSIERILSPSENAFDKYSEILESIKKHGKNKLIILALGPTATVLAYELSKSNYVALDIGHIDIEYEWFKLGVTERVAIENKYTNEVKNGNLVKQIDNEEYKNQIIEIIQ